MSGCVKVPIHPLLMNSNLKVKAKGYINKNQSIYIGNLINRLETDFPEASKSDIRYSFLQMMKEGYFFSKFGCVYHPNEVNENEKKLTKFVSQLGLEDIVLEILLALDEMGDNAISLPSLSLKVISQNSSHDEMKVKYVIGILFKDGLIVAKPSDLEPQYLVINWELVEEVIG